MKKRYVLGIIGLLLGIGLTPNISADIFPIVDDNTVNVQPGIEIKYPIPGLYFFGDRLVNLSIIFIIGPFTIQAGSYHPDNDMYIECIEFYLDDKLIAKDTEPPFDCFCAVKHFGKGTIKAIGYYPMDNQYEDSINLWYFKFL